VYILEYYLLYTPIDYPSAIYKDPKICYNSIMLIERTFIRSIFTLSFNFLITRDTSQERRLRMSKIYKVIFNKNEIVVESNKRKTISKNKSEMNVIANDVLDCLNKAKELFFKQYNQYAKSIEVVKSANTSTNMIVNNYSQKVSA
jgi:hypothetical protein|tara:strand:- start:337 stop:771 length:435 start_codon:yes stop_codon:yes gene_type:complete